MTNNRAFAKSYILIAACSAALTLSLQGCGTHTTDQATAHTDFNYKSPEKFDTTGLTIALVKPSIPNPDIVPPPPPDSAPTFAKQADGYTVEAQMQIGLMQPDQTAKQFRSMFEKNYRPELRAAVNKAIAGILEDKGFAVVSVDKYDQPVGIDGKPAYLASLPNLTLGFGNKTESQECANNICTQKGMLLIDGQYLYQMAEPVTGTSVAYRRMNLYGLHIEEPYILQTYKQKPGVAAKIKHLFGAGEDLVDTREQALVSGLNTLYKQTMAETDLTISRPQLLALSETLKELKSGGPLQRHLSAGGSGAGG